MTKDLADLLAKAKLKVESMTPAEREAMYKAQKESWVRGEMEIGLDADERKWKEEHGF